MPFSAKMAFFVPVFGHLAVVTLLDSKNELCVHVYCLHIYFLI